MKYKTIQILRKHILTDKIEERWMYEIKEGDGQDHVEEETTPNGWGFYHYPETMSDTEAFQKLKEHLIALREKDIERISYGLEGLKALEFKEQK